MTSRTPSIAACAALLLAAGLCASAAGAANLTILNDDGPGEGFNDPTPTAPIPGNPGATLGQQRLNVFQAAADAWGEILDSAIDIPILAGFDPLFCDPTSALLGGAAPATFIFGGGLGEDWHPFALANAREGIDIGPFIGLEPGAANIGATFNSTLDDDPDCLGGITWWYGIGTPAPAGTIDFFSTVFHEIGHGLGFTTTVDRETGELLQGMNDVYMKNLEDHSTGETWPDMTDAERAASAVDTGDLHWVGPSVVGASTALLSGAHPSGHVRMYAPDPLEQGSSIAHWDTVLFPDEVMEPFAVAGAQDILTTELMEDIGWPLLAPGCVPSLTTLCLREGRFKIEVEWDTGIETGPGRVVPGGTRDSSNIWFFGPNNWELLIKVLNGCPITNHYWVFFAATTDVEFRVTVTDTERNVSKQYFNPLGQPANAVTDTSALMTCP